MIRRILTNRGLIGGVTGLMLMLPVVVVYAYTYEPELMQATPLEMVYGLSVLLFLQSLSLGLSEWLRYEAERERLVDEFDL